MHHVLGLDACFKGQSLSCHVSTATLLVRHARHACSGMPDMLAHHIVGCKGLCQRAIQPALNDLAKVNALLLGVDTVPCDALGNRRISRCQACRCQPAQLSELHQKRVSGGRLLI